MLPTTTMTPATAGRFHRWQTAFRNTARTRFTGRTWQRPGIAEPGGSGDEGGDSDGGQSGTPQRYRASRRARWQSMLILASLASFFGVLLGACKKKKKKGGAESSSAISHNKPQMMPLEAYIRGSSKAMRLPKRGKLRRWRVKRLKNKAKQRAKREMKRMLKGYKEKFQNAFADCKLRSARFGFTILSKDYKRIITKDMSGTSKVHYEYRILWKEAYCKYHYNVGAVLRRERQTTSNPNYNDLYIRR